MTRIFLASMALSLSVIAPLSAQEWQMPPAEEPPATAPDEPLSDFEQGIESMMNEMFQRFQPHLEGLGNELAETVTEFGPAFEELAGLMDDIGNYQRPERLPNGDIIIRRRADAPPPPSTNELQRLLPEGNKPGNPGENGREPQDDLAPPSPIEL